MHQHISIIHGARYFHEKKGLIPEWTYDLKNYFENTNLIQVHCFFWDGGIRNGLSKDLVKKYADHIINVYESLSSEEKEIGISIFAKSLGGIIAERALNYLYENEIIVKIRTFIKVATPDLRNFTGIHQTSKVYDIYSYSDHYRLLMSIPLSIIIIFWLRMWTKKVKSSIIKVKGVEHSGFNKNVNITISEHEQSRLLFEYYLTLLEVKY